ncbi:hypothetical protein FKP32DRAFT_1672560 [Trametes sanguinea]|nr:hypothetical protein FKP32DRAFT_1674092 [Trametes sanguinea]KAI9067997.1 hypothetical protein FKP32DRAFT_1672560 [Trametes sanguinea]
MTPLLLHRRHYKTMTSILKDGHNTRQKITLHDVAAALVALGFSVISDKGSKYHFDPPCAIGRVALRIHVHTHDLQFYQQDALKRSMEKLYGWGAGTFVCA